MKIILVAAARPNFMKIAPLMRAIQKHNSAYRKTQTHALFLPTISERVLDFPLPGVMDN
jgi:hypothetical protein